MILHVGWTQLGDSFAPHVIQSRERISWVAHVRWEHPRWSYSQCVAVVLAVFWDALHFSHVASHTPGPFPSCCFSNRITQTSLHNSWLPIGQNQVLHYILRTRLRSQSCPSYNILLVKTSHKASSDSKGVWWEEWKVTLQNSPWNGRDCYISLWNNPTPNKKPM